LISQKPIDLSELADDWKKKTRQLWNSRLPCKTIQLGTNN